MIREQTEHPLVRQIDEFFPIVEEAIRTIDSKMKGLVSVARAQAEPAEVPLIERAIGEYNDQMGRLVGLTADLRRPMDDVKATCQALQSIREAGERWLERVVPENCDPLAENLRRENMQGFFSYSWRRAAVEAYWDYMEKCYGAAAGLSELGGDVGNALIVLADAIDQRSMAVALATANVGASFLSALSVTIGLSAAVGAGLGSLAGGVGAAPGAAIGAIVGIVAGLIAAFLTLEMSLVEYDMASKIDADAAALELRELKNDIRRASNRRWAGWYGSYEGSDFRRER